MMTKRTELYIDFAGVDSAHARVQMFTEFNKRGDAKISSMLIDPLRPRMIVSTTGELSEEQRAFRINPPA